jgi:hypothetical protein
MSLRCLETLLKINFGISFQYSRITVNSHLQEIQYETLCRKHLGSEHGKVTRVQRKLVRRPFVHWYLFPWQRHGQCCVCVVATYVKL